MIIQTDIMHRLYKRKVSECEVTCWQTCACTRKLGDYVIMNLIVQVTDLLHWVGYIVTNFLLIN